MVAGLGVVLGGEKEGGRGGLEDTVLLERGREGRLIGKRVRCKIYVGSRGESFRTR